METIERLPEPTIETYLRHVATFEVNLRVRERRLRRSEWRLWRRYQRTERDQTLALLSLAMTLNDQAEASLRFARRVLG